MLINYVFNFNSSIMCLILMFMWLGASTLTKHSFVTLNRNKQELLQMFYILIPACWVHSDVVPLSNSRLGILSHYCESFACWLFIILISHLYFLFYCLHLCFCSLLVILYLHLQKTSTRPFSKKILTLFGSSKLLPCHLLEMFAMHLCTVLTELRYSLSCICFSCWHTIIISGMSWHLENVIQ